MSDTASKTSRSSAAADHVAQTGEYRLTTSFPYLVRRVGLRIGELFDRAVAAWGIDVSMWRVLAALAEQDNQQLGQLSGITTIELSTLSRLVGTMASMGLLTRRRPRGNGRIVEISLSAKGRRLAEQIIPIAEHFEAVAVGGLSPPDIERLKDHLGAAYRNLDRLENEFAVLPRPRTRSARKERPAGKRAASTKRNVEA